MTAEQTAELHGRRIVITRSIADNRSLASRLEALGAEAIGVPLIETLPPADGGAALADAVDRLADYRWVILTSVNGVDALRDALAGRPWPATLTVVPVGPTTAAAASACGMNVGDAPPSATAESLVEVFPDRAEGHTGRILAPLAELAGTTVTDGLRAKGYEVDRVTAYRTAAPSGSSSPASASAGSSSPVPPDADIFGADAVTFFSPSAVDRFLDRFGDPFDDRFDERIDTRAPSTTAGSVRPTLAVCIGPATTARAKGRGFAELVTAAEHTEAGVIDALVNRLGSQREPRRG